ncbi:MAG: hypothetical protein M3Y86_08310 [Verrucomicrobiota bacterium]|nr:hypothetical protein [Verrucomicrobiota bacterium]
MTRWRNFFAAAGRFFVRTQLKPLFILVALCLLIREQFPFSNFPMYSGFSRTTKYVFIADGDGRPIATVPATGTSTPTLKKIFDSAVQKERARLRKSHRELTDDDRAVIGRALLADLRTFAVARNNAAPLPPVLRLYETVIHLEHGHFDRQTTLVAQLP